MAQGRALERGPSDNGGPPALRRLHGELGQIAQAQGLFDVADLLHGLIETVAAKLRLFDILEFRARLLDIVRADGFLPGREDDRVFARGMVCIHQLELFQALRQRVRIFLPAPCRSGS